ncbi:MAG: SURF1 family protein [Janthinobacterium lividum]
MTDRQTPQSARFEGGHPHGGRLWRVLVVTIFLFLFAGFTALGVWQVYRLGWKLALIERVETRIHAAPVEAPPPDVTITRDDHEYLRVKVSGRFRHDLETPVKAVTDLGGGWWILTPLETDRGFTVLVNRGFVPPELKEPSSRPDAPETASVTGLLRLGEGDGAFLRHNDPAANNWYAREVPAILSTRGVTGPAASYFIDAQADTAQPAEWPRAGLTVVKFTNSHLVYALTWFGLAAGSLIAMVLVLRERRRKEQAGA